jgi:hypothetical protein
VSRRVSSSRSVSEPGPRVERPPARVRRAPPRGAGRTRRRRDRRLRRARSPAADPAAAMARRQIELVDERVAAAPLEAPAERHREVAHDRVVPVVVRQHPQPAALGIGQQPFDRGARDRFVERVAVGRSRTRAGARESPARRRGRRIGKRRTCGMPAGSRMCSFERRGLRRSIALRLRSPVLC